MRDELYVRDPGLRLPMLEAATVLVQISAPLQRNYLPNSQLSGAASALRTYVARRCLHNGADSLPGNEAARYLQRWALPADDPRRTDVQAAVGWGLLWDLSRRPGFGLRMTVGCGSPWPSVRDPHAGPPCRAYA